MSYDGSIQIDTSLNTTGFNNGLKSMVGSLGKLTAALGVTIGIAAGFQFLKAGEKAARSLSTALSGLGFVIKANGRDFQQAKSFIDNYISDGLVPATDAIEAYKNMVSRGYDTSQIESMMNIMKDSAVYNRQSAFSIGEAIVKTTQGLRMENSMLTDSVGIQKNVAKMWDEYAASIGTTANRLTLAQKRQAEFNGFMAEGGVFAGAASEYLNTYAGKLSQLSAGFTNLKVAVGNSVIPIINAILPAINAAVTALTRLFNRIAVIMQVLFGYDPSATVAAYEQSMGGVASTTQSAADAQDELAKNTEKAQKAAKGALASFDQLNVLQQKDEGAGSGDSGIITPVISDTPIKLPAIDTSAADASLDQFKTKIEGIKESLALMFEPTIEALGRLQLALEPLQSFTSDGLIGFYENFLKPVGGWVLGEGLPRFIDVLAVEISKIDFETINASFNNLWDSLAPFAINVGEGLLWLWENVLVPLGGYVVNALLPPFLVLLASVLDTLNSIIDANKPNFQWIYDNFLKPVAEWTGGIIVQVIEDLTTAFKKFSDWCSSNQTVVSFMTNTILIFLSELWLYNTVKRIASWITGTLVPAFASFGATLTGVNAPLILAGVAFAILTAGIISLAQNWDKLSPAERAITILSGLAAAATAAAIAIAVFHTAWTVGIAAAAIAGGLAILASTLLFTGNNMPDLTSGIGSMSNASMLMGQNYGSSPLPQLATGAVIPPNAAFAAVLGDQKSGRNIEAPEKLIRQIVREETEGISGGQNITVQFGGTMGELIRVLRPEIQKEDKRVGKSLISRATT